MTMPAFASSPTRDFDVAPSHDREITRMAPQVTVPPEMFRRKEAHKRLLKAEQAILAFRDAIQLDYRAAGDAGFFYLAAIVAREIKRGDLAFEFERLAQEAVNEGASARPMRVHDKSKKRTRRPRTQPEQPTHRTRHSVDMPREDRE